MPLIKGKSSKAFGKNVKIEMNAGKPQKQALAIAYSIKRKAPKKMADGGDTSQASSTPQPTATPAGYDQDFANKLAASFNKAKGGLIKKAYFDGGDVNDKDELNHNSSKKSLKDADWDDESTIDQARSASPHPLSRPKQLGSDAYSKRFQSEISEDRIDSEALSDPKDKPRSSYEDESNNKSGLDLSDKEREHSNSKVPYEESQEDNKYYAKDSISSKMLARGGKVELKDGQPEEESAEDMTASKLAALMVRKMFAEGGMLPVDHGIEEDERSDEDDMESMLAPSHESKPSKQYESPYYSGPSVPDMEDEHSTGRAPYAKGGMADEDEEPTSIADHIMKKRNAKKMFADGGEVDLDLNSMEQPNDYYKQNEDAALKENYDSDFRDETQPLDSNLQGHDLPDEDEHDMVDKILSKIRSKRSLR